MTNGMLVSSHLRSKAFSRRNNFQARCTCTTAAIFNQIVSTSQSVSLQITNPPLEKTKRKTRSTRQTPMLIKLVELTFMYQQASFKDIWRSIWFLVDPTRANRLRRTPNFKKKTQMEAMMAFRTRSPSSRYHSHSRSLAKHSTNTRQLSHTMIVTFRTRQAQAITRAPRVAMMVSTTPGRPASKLTPTTTVSTTRERAKMSCTRQHQLLHFSASKNQQSLSVPSDPRICRHATKTVLSESNWILYCEMLYCSN